MPYANQVVNRYTSGSGTITALNGAVTFQVQGTESVVFSITGTWVATLLFQGQTGDGNWTNIIGCVQGNGNAVAAITANAVIGFSTGGLQQVRVTASLFTSGTVSVSYTESSGNNCLQVFNLVPSSLQAAVTGNVASGATDSGNGVKVSTIANTILPTVTAGQRVDMQSDLNGRVYVNAVPVDGSKTSYSGGAIITTAATATDIFTIAGSGTKTIRVTYVSISLTGTISTTLSISLIKRSAADTGGTSTAVTAVPHDSANAAATAAVLAYTANPAVGAAVGTMRVEKLDAVTSGGNGSPAIVWDFGMRPAQAIVLRGTAQQLAVNLNATSITGGSANVSIEWTEE